MCIYIFVDVFVAYLQYETSFQRKITIFNVINGCLYWLSFMN